MTAGDVSRPEILHCKVYHVNYFIKIHPKTKKKRQHLNNNNNNSKNLEHTLH